MQVIAVDRLENDEDDAVVRRFPVHPEGFMAHNAEAVQEALVLFRQAAGFAGRPELVLLLFEDRFADEVRHDGGHEHIAEFAAALLHLFLGPQARFVEGGQGELAGR